MKKNKRNLARKTIHAHVRSHPDYWKADWALRLAVFGTFVGHGVFALMGKQSWIPYLTTVGIPKETAGVIMPIIGLVDIMAAIITLYKPVRAVLLWMVFWSFATALIRPISGEPIWDMIERTANWGAPLALLYLRGFPTNIKEFFSS